MFMHNPSNGPEPKMCLNPSFVWVLRGPKHEKIPVPCKGCWQCRASRLNDYVGRCLCEVAYCEAVSVVTLTYAPRDDLADKIITPEHFQKFIRAVRRRGHRVRYLAVGEYGALKGRAHFHAILFWGKPKPNRDYPAPQIRPDMPHKEMFTFPSDIWPHGHAFADNMSHNEVDERAIRYVCKYLLKDEGSDYWFTISKKPPIGVQYFLDKADRDAELGVFPQSFNYRPPASHEGRNYLLTGATKRFYLERLINQMAVKHNVPVKKLNEWTYKAIQKLEKWQWNKEYLDAMTPEENLAFLADKLDILRPDEEQTAKQIARETFYQEKIYSENSENFRASDLTPATRSATFEKCARALQAELTQWLVTSRKQREETRPKLVRGVGLPYYKKP